MQDTFSQFIEKKQRHHVAITPTDLAKRKARWLASIDRLYQNINEWLQPYIKDGAIIIERSSTTLSEEQLGSYSVPQLKIFVVDTAVDVVPRGTYLLGAYGRVDIDGRKGAYSLIEKDWDKWSVSNLPKPGGAAIRQNLTEELFKAKLMNIA
jgi:hypothetical protein